MPRYAAKLLFQFRVDLGKDSGKRRICEERIISFTAKSDRGALRLAKQRGKKACFSYKNSGHKKVHFEFVGIMDLMSLGREAEDDEVWYDIYQRVLPMERRDKILPSDANLLDQLNPSMANQSLNVQHRISKSSLRLVFGLMFVLTVLLFSVYFQHDPRRY